MVLTYFNSKNGFNKRYLTQIRRLLGILCPSRFFLKKIRSMQFPNDFLNRIRVDKLSDVILNFDTTELSAMLLYEKKKFSLISNNV